MFIHVMINLVLKVVQCRICITTYCDGEKAAMANGVMCDCFRLFLFCDISLECGRRMSMPKTVNSKALGVWYSILKLDGKSVGECVFVRHG